jgi:rhamnosyltransferase subunit B
MVTVPGRIHLRKAGPLAYRAGLNVCRLAVWHWSNPVRRLRRELGLGASCDPVFRDKFSPDLVLAHFSAHLAQKQPDWPGQTFQPGFIYLDDTEASNGLTAEVESFLAAGDPPVVFALGPTAVHNPGNFYEVSAEVAKQLGRMFPVLLTISGAHRRVWRSCSTIRTLLRALGKCERCCWKKMA